MKSSQRTIVLWVVLIAIFIGVWSAMDKHPREPASIDRLSEDIDAVAVESVRIALSGSMGVAHVTLRDGSRYETRPLPVRTLLSIAEEVPVAFEADSTTSFASAAISVGPALIVVVLFIAFMRALRGKGTTRSVDEMIKGSMEAKKVASPPTALRGLTEARHRLLAACRSTKDGEPGPRRILISGPPGSGKTLLVQTVAAEAGLPLVALSGSEFAHVFVGVGAGRVRSLFEKAAAAAPCIALIEDVDAFAVVRRVAAEKDGNITEAHSTLLELCNRLDGLAPFPKGVVFVATTNRLDLLDPALVRPGRIEMRLELEPDTTSKVFEQPLLAAGAS